MSRFATRKTVRNVNFYVNYIYFFYKNLFYNIETEICEF